MPGFRFVIWIFFATTAMAFAGPDCQLYELKGDVSQGENITLTVNKGTNSQKVFTFSPEVQFEMGPYINRHVHGKFITNRTLILQIQNPELEVPDPLHHDHEMVLLRSEQCPKPDKKKGRRSAL